MAVGPHVLCLGVMLVGTGDRLYCTKNTVQFGFCFNESLRYLKRTSDLPSSVSTYTS